MAGILNKVMNFGLFTARLIPSLAEKPIASQEGLCHIKLLLFNIILCRFYVLCCLHRVHESNTSGSHEVKCTNSICTFYLDDFLKVVCEPGAGIT